MERETLLHQRIRWLTDFFITGLVLSGATAIPLVAELKWLANFFGMSSAAPIPWNDGVRGWIWHVWTALRETSKHYPFLFYGTDWLAFGHFVIALAFVGAWRDPVRNRWLFDFGMIACVLVIPYAFVFGDLRGIPVWWRLVAAGGLRFRSLRFHSALVLPQMGG